MDQNTTNFNKATSPGKTMTHRQLSFCPETSAADADGLLRAVTKVWSQTGRSKSPGGLSLGLTAPAAEAQSVINCPSGFTRETGYLTLANPLVDGSIRLISGQGGWTC
jgi:hypothetical protein